MSIKKRTPVTIGTKSMTLQGLNEEMVNQLINSLAINPNIEPHIKEKTLAWCRLQLAEQQNGGAWKLRMREAGYVI